MTIEEVVHRDKDGNILWSIDNLHNQFHTQGQEFILKAVFAGSSGVTIPTTYYVGLDNRPVVNQADILANISGEPTTFGYVRQTLSSQTGFGAVFDMSNWKIITASLIFIAIGGSWGPVKNAFLTTGSGSQGFLISTVPLPNVKTINSGETFSFKINLALGN